MLYKEEQQVISARMEEALNKQINAELYSAYLYLSMEAFYQGIGLPGFANWMYVQFQEEQAHARILMKYMYDRGGRVKLMPVDGPETEWDSPSAPFDHVARHEAHVTSLINNLVNLATEEKDHATVSMLKWFVDEQVEEEKNAADIVAQLKLMADAPGGLYMLDQKLATRVFVLPAPLAVSEV